MKSWSFNQDFPITLYMKVTNLEEYIEAINNLKNPINVTGKYYNEILDVEVFPYSGDLSLWKETFIEENSLEEEVLNEDVLKLKPKKEEYPVMLVYRNNYKDFYWIPLNELK